MPKRKSTSTNTSKPLPPVEYLRECFNYIPKSGKLWWFERPRHHFPDERACKIWNTRWALTEAGFLAGKPKCRYVCMDYVKYKAHRIIWKWMTGQEPPSTLDHKDRNPANNRWTNLRPANMSQQMFNAGMYKNNKSGHRGVLQRKRRHSDKWSAQTTVNGIRHYFGLFDTPEEASIAYETAARELHGEFYRKPK